MILSNLHFTTFLLFIGLLILSSIILNLLYKREKNKNLFILFLAFIFLIINIFEIKGGYNKELRNIEGGKVVFALDISKSMLSKDIKKGDLRVSRINGVKGLIDQVITSYTYNLYGLIAFAGESIEVIPFTEDSSIFKTMLYGVNPNNISKYGTNLNSVFDSLITYFSGYKEGGLAVIFTDGGDEDIKISNDVINKLKAKNIKILLVGVGTKLGAKIPVGIDFFGRDIYKVYKGKEIVTKLNSDILKKISNKYGFNYIELKNINNYNGLKKDISNNIDYISLEKNINNRVDYTRFFILLSLIFFTIFLVKDQLLGKKK